MDRCTCRRWAHIQSSTPPAPATRPQPGCSRTGSYRAVSPEPSAKRWCGVLRAHPSQSKTSGCAASRARRERSWTRASLQASTTATFEVARRSAFETVAVPAVGTGIAGLPLDDCARIMATCLSSAFHDGWEPSEVRFVLYDEAAHSAFEPPFLTTFH